MRDETIGSFLTRLAARSAAPGGGATGALHAAQAAALLAMVARFSDGPRYDAETVGRVRAAADGLADEAVGIAVADQAAFEVVISAYVLPKDTEEEKAARAERRKRLLVGSATLFGGIVLMVILYSFFNRNSGMQSPALLRIVAGGLIVKGLYDLARGLIDKG